MKIIRGTAYWIFSVGLLWGAIFAFAWIVGHFSYALEIGWFIFCMGIIFIPLLLWVIQKIMELKKGSSS